MFSDVDAAALVGSVGTAHLVVSAADTAEAVGSGDLAVLGTPVMIALMERAACAAVVDRLPAGATTVGTRVDVRHLAPSPVGTEVTARAVVVGVDRGRVTFEVSAEHVVDGQTVAVGTGTHVRAAVDRARFPGTQD